MLKSKRRMFFKKGVALFAAVCMFFSVPVNFTALAKEDSNLTDFVSRSGGTVEKSGNVVTLSKINGGDHFAMYNGSEEELTEFTFEADVRLADGISAALVFGAKSDNPGGNHWYAANFNKDNETDTLRVFCVPNGAHEGLGHYANRSKENLAGLNLDEELHMSISVNTDGAFIYRIKNTGSDNEIKLNGTLDHWGGGHVGLLTFDSEAVFSNISLSDEYKEDEKTDPEPLDNEEGLLHTNLEELKIGEGSGSWEITEEGLHGSGTGDNFILSESQGTDFIYEADVTFKEARGAASLIFRSNNKVNPKNSYVANINGENGEARLFKFQNNDGINLVKTTKVPIKDSYHLKVVAIGKHILFYVDEILVANTGDYLLSPGDTLGGQNTAIFEGHYGLLSWNANAVYQNVYYTEIKNDNSPLLSDLQLEAIGGEAEAPNNFKSYQYSYLQYVDHETTTAKILPTPVNADTEIIITDRNGTVIDERVSLEEGENLFTVTASHKITKATVVYRYYIHRRAAADSYYYEPYRGQYHYSVKEGWANDPNGMVYYNGKWHLFYQFYNDTNWGPMHWAHAVSTDLIHWEEQPITFYPDEYGTMFSGCAVVDENNTSGLFGDGEEGGLVALITASGNGQRVILAYSQDGEHWEKTEDVAADWTEDPLRNRDFRDPKVFRYQDKWFMVIAGGPLRIYSSDNLRDWEAESVYPDLHTECPDLYRLPCETEDGIDYKWVLSRGGRNYKIGDFKQVDGNWTFVPDESYENQDGIMNFGKDSYAAMTYYINSYDDVQPRVIEINWMNNWDYCNNVDDASGNDRFNGTFNLQLELSLAKDSNGTYLLKQTPIEEYKELRDEEKTYRFENAIIRPGENILEDFTGDTYEIIAKFQPEDNVKEFGFYVRKGENEKTEIKYNRETRQLSVDRRESGLSPGSLFSQEYQQNIVVEEDDDGITMHIFVDRSSIEVFGQDYTMACALQIFPEVGSKGIEVFSRGGETSADITLCYLNSIWGIDTEDTEPRYISINQKKATLSLGKELDLKAFVSPEKASQEIVWSTEDTEVIELTNTASGVKVKGLKKGTAVVTAVSAAKPSLKTSCQITVRENNVKTNLEGWRAIAGEWYADGDYYYGNSNDNAFFYSGEKTEYTEYTYKTDVEFESGIVNIIFASATTNAYEGCYSVQLVGNRVRLFDFRQDKTFTVNENLEIPNDNIYRVKITVTKNEQNQNVIKVMVNDTEYIHYTVTDGSRIYDNGYFALGIYNTNAKFRNIFAYEPADQEKANEVIAKINAIGNVEYTESSKALIDTAKAAYEALTPVQKELVTNISKLMEAEQRYLELKKKSEETKISITRASVVSIPDQKYSGKAIKPSVKLSYAGKELVTNKDYIITYSSNVNIGTAKVTITGKGDYTGNLTKTFKIVVKKNSTYYAGNYKYKITNANLSGKGTVAVTGVKKKTLKKIEVPNSVAIGGKRFKVTVIAKSAFKNCTKATSAVIGKNVKIIRKNAFNQCKKLNKISIKSTVLTKVEKNAIKGIKSKAVITCPKKQKAKYKNIFKTSTGYKKTMTIKTAK